MSARLWNKVRGGSSGSRLFAAYLAVVLVVAIVGPGLAVYASDEVVEAAEESVPGTQTPSAEEAASSALQPVVNEGDAKPVKPAEASVLAPELYPAVVAAAAVTPVLSGDGNPALTAGGIRLNAPSSGTYTAIDCEKIVQPVPSDFSVNLTVFETDDGWFMSFTSNYPISSVVMKGGSSGAYVYTYDPAVMGDTNLHCPANPNGKWAALSHVDFYFGTVTDPEPGDLTVYKYRDDNRNGEHDLDEALLEDWAFTLYGADDVAVGSGTTGVDGSLLFADLEPGTYHATETMQSGWENTTSLTQYITVTEGGDHELWFGNVPSIDDPDLGSLTIYKFRDDNRNGERDNGEPMLPDWQFTLYQATQPSQLAAIGIIGTGTTDANGELSFDELLPGEYHVTETLVPGWENTTPLTRTVEIEAEETTEVWFGNVPEAGEPETGTLIIHKFEDENENKVRDLGESMLGGWEFTVINPAGPVAPSSMQAAVALIGTGATNGNGELMFSDLAPGSVRITETMKPGWTNTTDLTQDATIVAGQTTHVWFGNVQEFLPFTELDLAITKVADDRTVGEGQLVTYTLTWWNLMSDEDALDYTIVDDFDERYVTVVDAAGGTVSGGKITWTFAGPLSKAMGPQTLKYTVRVRSDMPDRATNIDNVVMIDDDRDFNPANNRDDERIVYRPDEPFLPFTGGEYLLLIAAAMITGVAGLLLRKPHAS